MIAFQCPHCQKPYKVKDEYAGRTTRCQGCQNSLKIPAAPSVPAAPAAPPIQAAPPAGGAPPTAPAPAVKPAPVARTEARPAPSAGAAAPMTAPAAPQTAKAPVPAPPTMPSAPAPSAPPAQTPAAAQITAAGPSGQAAPPAPNASAPAASPPTPAPAEEMIKLDCFYCEEAIQFPVSLANRQAPCPKCARIIKVPAIVKEQPRDWRQLETGLAAARRRPSAETDDAWASSTAVTTVSRKALVEAGVIQTEAPPAPAGLWVRRIGILAVVVLVLGGGWWAIAGYLSSSREQQMVDRVRNVLSSSPPVVRHEDRAEMYRALGEYYLRQERFSAALARLGPADRMTPARTASDQFMAARMALAPGAESTPVRQALLIDLGRSVAQLAGTEAQVRDGKRLTPEATVRELRAVLDAFGTTVGPRSTASATARSEFLRQVSRDLIARGPDPMRVALSVASGASEKLGPESLAMVALELLRAGKTNEATIVADSIVPEGAKPAETDPSAPPGPAQMALAVLLNREKAAQALDARAKAPILALDNRLGRIDGKARLKQMEAAQALVQQMPTPVDRLRGQAVLAAVALDRPEPEMSGLTALVQMLGDMKAALPELADAQPDLNWQLWRVVVIAAQQGQAAAVRPVAEAIPDSTIRGLALLECFRAGLAKREAIKPEDVGTESLAFPLARGAWARQMALQGQVGRVDTEMKSWDDTSKGLGVAGVVLGLVNAR